jgi:hypothetical protein
MGNPRRRTQRTNRSAVRQAARNVSSANAAAVAVESEEVRASKMRDWQIEMKHINHDLRELLIITVILFALLFAVGFFL